MHNDLETNQLFVSGTPQDSTEDQIKEYFSSRFGLIHKVKLLQTGNRSRNFLVVATNLKVYQAILGTKGLVFRDRVLHCKPYIEQQSRLKYQIQEANDRRVILKKVPANISESKITTLIEKIAGEIEMIFPYRSETTAQALFHEFRKFRTYSVLFRNKNAAERLARLGNITLDESYSQPIKIEKYYYKRGESHQPIEHGSPLNHLRYQKKLGARARVRSTIGSDRGGLYRSQLIKSSEKCFSRALFNMERSAYSNSESLKFQRVDINANFHSMKPTTKNYFISNKKFTVQPECGLQIRLLLKSLTGPEKRT